jgi:hypothetical protein
MPKILATVGTRIQEEKAGGKKLLSQCIPAIFRRNIVSSMPQKNRKKGLALKFTIILLS